MLHIFQAVSQGHAGIYFAESELHHTLITGRIIVTSHYNLDKEEQLHPNQQKNRLRLIMLQLFAATLWRGLYGTVQKATWNL